MPDGCEVVVIGAGGHGKVIVRALQESGALVVAILDDDPALWDREFSGVPITGPIESSATHVSLPAVLAVGDNATRKALSERLDRKWLTVIHPNANVDSTAVLGPGTVVLSGAIVQPDTQIGSHAIINTGASVDHDCVVGDFVHVAPGTRLAGEVSVGEGAFLGIGSSVIPNIDIGAWTMVGAGAAVVNHLAERILAVGVPAKPTTRMDSTSPPSMNLPVGTSPGDGGKRSPRDPNQAEHLTSTADLTSLPETLEEAAAKEQASDQANDDKPPRIYLSPPHMSPRERELLLDAFDSNWIAPLGPHVDAFEKEFAQKVGAREAVALSSGTAALHLSLILAGVEQGDEVLTSSLTFAATANAITYVGATPVFIDSDSESWNMDPELLGEELEASAKRGKMPKAVVIVDLYGQCAEYDRIAKICRFYDVPLIEDAAEALGATYRGKSAGTFGSFGVFSFNGNKIITTSGGGMLVTDQKELADKARFLATQARDPAPHYQHSEIGYNYRMSNLLAAVGRGQLAELDSRVNQRRANFEYYSQALGDVPGIRFMPEISGGRSTRWLTCLLVDPDKFGATTEEIRLAHERENIESRPLWKPMHMQPVFAQCAMRGGTVSEQLFEQGLCLPSGSSLSQHERQRVVEVLLAAGNRRTTPIDKEEKVATSVQAR